MWQSSIRRTGALPFADFLESEEYSRLVLSTVNDSTPKCLLDIVEMWVVHGDATSICPSFETFIYTVVDIIDSWYENRSEVYTSVLWFTDDDPTVEIRLLSSKDGVHGQSPWEHPVMNRSNFEFQQAYNQVYPHRVAL